MRSVRRFPSLVEAFAKPQSGNFRLPKPITAPHETAAVGMAHGYFKVTGKPLITMVGGRVVHEAKQ